MAKVALYGRVSGHEQKEQETIDTQRHFLEEWAAQNGHEVVGWYADEAVRSVVPIMDRPEGGRLVRDARKGQFDIVAIYHIRRWSRYMQVWYDGKKLLDEAGVELICLNDDLRDETPGDRFSLGVKLLVGEYDRDLIAQNCLDGRYRRAHEGGYTGGVVPYGYRVAGTRRKWLEPDPAEAAIVRQIYSALVDERASCVQIARRLNALRVPTACQSQEEGRHRRHCTNVRGLWSNTRISRIVRNPIYCGERQFGASNQGRRGTVTQRVVPLVDPETWARAQKRLEENLIVSRSNAKYEYLLRGVVFCTHCGRRCYGKTMNKGKSPTSYYICNRKTLHLQGYEPDLPPCPMRHVRADALEGDVWSKLLPLILDADATIQKLQVRLEDGDGQQSSIRETIDGLRLAVERKRTARRRAVDLATDGLITREELADQTKRLEAEGEELEAQIEELTHQLSSEQHREQLVRRAGEWLRHWQEKLSGDVTPAVKREAVECFVVRIELTQTEDGIQPTYDFVLNPSGRSHAPYVTAYGIQLLRLTVPGSLRPRAA